MTKTNTKIALLFYVCLIYLSSIEFSQSTCIPQDINALLQIKYHFKNTSSFSNWDPKTDCCTWKNVQCNNDMTPGRVNFLFFDNLRYVSGSIPEAVGDLAFLNVLQFSRLPNLVGPIPLAITKLNSTLQVLVIKQNKKVSGTIPGFLSQLTSVGQIDLSSNNFSGTIPSSLSVLPNVFTLDLSSNKLTGSIPESFESFKPGVDLKVANNQLSSLIPKSLAKADFSGLDVSRNNFTRDVSFLFGSTKRVGDLSLKENNFKFNFTNVVLPQNLRTIDISYNQIYGSIPNGPLPVLQSVDFSNNQLCGEIPSIYKQFDASKFANNKCLCGAPLPLCK